MQKCRTCDCVKPLEEFSLRKDSGRYRTNCKVCRSNDSAAQRYGVTVGEIEQMKQDQGNSCAACGIHADEIDHGSFCHNPLVIDHDHATGKVRGLLCSTCNSALGHVHDSIETLQNLITYLKKQLG